MYEHSEEDAVKTSGYIITFGSGEQGDDYSEVHYVFEELPDLEQIKHDIEELTYYGFDEIIKVLELHGGKELSTAAYIWEDYGECDFNNHITKKDYNLQWSNLRVCLSRFLDQLRMKPV